MTVSNLSEQWLAQEASLRQHQKAPGVASREDLAARSGIDFFEAMQKGEIPPPHIAALLGFMLVDIEPGRVVFQGTPSVAHYNPLGMVHGGYAATLLDSCVGCAVHSMLPQGKGYTTLELKVNYVRGMNANTGPVRAEGRVVSLGNQVGVAEGKLTDAQGKLYAVATTTCLVFPL